MHLSASFTTSINLSMEDLKREQQEWIKYVSKAFSLSYTNLARMAAIAPSTLNRFMNNPAHNTLLSDTTLRKISQFSGIKVLQIPDFENKGFKEQEAIPFLYDSERDTTLVAAVRNLLNNDRNRQAWRLKTNALDLAGYMPNDIVIVDYSLKPITGKIVCAQQYSDSLTTSETIFRVYEQPFLIQHSISNTAAPLLVDDTKVKIIGVLAGSLRK